MFWNPKVHNRIHKSPSPVHILSQIKPVHAPSPSLRVILILSSHLRLGLPSGLLRSGFPINILYAPIFSPIRATFPGTLLYTVIMYWFVPMGRDSSVGIAARYELNGSGTESRWGEGGPNFPQPSKPAPGPSQPPTQWVPGTPFPA